MDSSSRENAADGVASATSAPESANAVFGTVANEAAGTSGGDLQKRPIPGRRLSRKMRCLDDPEVLQRVLAGLLNLQ